MSEENTPGAVIGLIEFVCPKCKRGPDEVEIQIVQKIPVWWPVQKLQEGKLVVDSSYTGGDAEDEDKMHFVCHGDGKVDCGHTWDAEKLEALDLINWV